MQKTPHRGAILSAGLLLGTGLGGFVDGIVLHQIVQWHNMLSSVRPPIDLVEMKYNMVWDGIFHAFTWIMTALGVARLWTAGKFPKPIKLSSSRNAWAEDVIDRWMEDAAAEKPASGNGGLRS